MLVTFYRSLHPMNEKLTHSQTEPRPGPNWMDRFRVSFSLARAALQETLYPTPERLPSYHGYLAVPEDHITREEPFVMQQAERIREEALAHPKATDDAPLPSALLDILDIQALDILDQDY